MPLIWLFVLIQIPATALAPANNQKVNSNKKNIQMVKMEMGCLSFTFLSSLQ